MHYANITNSFRFLKNHYNYHFLLLVFATFELFCYLCTRFLIGFIRNEYEQRKEIQ